MAENLMNSEHKATTPQFRDRYDNVLWQCKYCKKIHESDLVCPHKFWNQKVEPHLRENNETN